LAPSSSARRDSAVLSEADLQFKRDELFQSLSSSKPKHILQSLSFLTNLSSQALLKRYPNATPSRAKPREDVLFPLKQQLVETAEKLATLQNTISNLPRKEYATTEAKCRALRAARTEALDRLDEIISGETPSTDDDWSNDVAAAKELIVPLSQELM
jgi:hypothetical protein